MASERKLKVYYNSACPVCNAGIEMQKKRKSTCFIEWKDVHKDEKARADLDTSLEKIREKLHVVEPDGTLKVGVEAFQSIWQHSEGEEWKARWIGRPYIKPIAIVAYNLFAKCLYIWNRALHHW